MANKNDIVKEIVTQALINGINPAFALAVFEHESSFNPQAINPKSGAAGIGQLMPVNYRKMGIDPFNYKQNIQYSLKLLKNYFKLAGGDYKLALKRYGGFVTKDPSKYIADIVKRYKKFDQPIKIVIEISKTDLMQLKHSLHRG